MGGTVTDRWAGPLIPRQKDFCFVEPVRLSVEEFNALPVATVGQDDGPRINGPDAPDRRLRALVRRDGRASWHVVQRQISYGCSVYYAAKIVVRVPAAARSAA